MSYEYLSAWTAEIYESQRAACHVKHSGHRADNGRRITLILVLTHVHVGRYTNTHTHSTQYTVYLRWLDLWTSTPSLSPSQWCNTGRTSVGGVLQALQRHQSLWSEQLTKSGLSLCLPRAHPAQIHTQTHAGYNDTAELAIDHSVLRANLSRGKKTLPEPLLLSWRRRKITRGFILHVIFPLSFLIKAGRFSLISSTLTLIHHNFCTFECAELFTHGVCVSERLSACSFTGFL